MTIMNLIIVPVPSIHVFSFLLLTYLDILVTGAMKTPVPSTSHCWQSHVGFDSSKNVPTSPDGFFDLFDTDKGDGCLNENEIQIMANAILPRTANYNPSGLKRLLKTHLPLTRYNFRHKIWPFFAARVALFVIDVQNDFINGSLKFPDAVDVVHPINYLVNYHGFHSVVYSKDWHPPNHISFWSNLHERSGNVVELRDGSMELDEIEPYTKVTFDGIAFEPFEQILWPEHCVQGSWGAEFHEDLEIKNGSIIIQKGTNPVVESYSAFFDILHSDNIGTGLLQKLRRQGIKVGVFTGLATDYCVGYSVLDALKSGIPSILVEEGVREISQDVAETRLKEIVDHGGIIFKYGNDFTRMMDCFHMNGSAPLSGIVLWWRLFVTSVLSLRIGAFVLRV
ncbi:uncharacterized protein [Lepeophtheirus salmonis]|uniref:uncharacterized protein n=1 Tax=Lepeophtheirus salmonis TaxID=72036 RepID=UPI001AE4F152|nr:uncharacterized protein LOC121126102 [Lepeophtheirus salmonis]